MAPTRTRKRKSNESTASVDTQTFPMAPPQLVPTKARSPARTPPSNRSPIRRPTAGITLAQKQALIDNLQLEITERARKLRAQYALQAQGLRTRIEIRVNRIPMSLRKLKMEDLMKKQSDALAKTVTSSTAAPKQPAKVASRTVLGESKGSRQSPVPPQRGTKRLSDALSTDKENEGIENLKKRARAPPAVRPPSRVMQSSRVLSPKSSNSRALPPQSPVRPALTSQRPNFARPVSPMKPPVSITGRSAAILSNMVEQVKGTRATGTTKTTASTTGARSVAGSVRGRKPATTATRSVRTASNASDTSHGSNGTTIVRKPITKKEPVKKAMGSVRGTGTTTAKKAVSERGTISRTLRKRN